MTDLLMTRPAEASARFLNQIDLGRAGRVVTSPLLSIQPTGALPDLAPYKGLLFTSSAGVKAYVDHGGSAGWDVQVVGPRTAEVARQAGLNPIFVAKDVDALAQGAVGAGPYLHCHGAHTTGDLAPRLSRRGIATDGCVLYDQVALQLNAEALDLLATSQRVLVPLFSPRTAQLFVQNCPLPAFGRLFVLALSPAIARILPSEVKVLAVSDPNGQAMVEAINKHLP